MTTPRLTRQQFKEMLAAFGDARAREPNVPRTVATSEMWDALSMHDRDLREALVQSQAMLRKLEWREGEAEFYCVVCKRLHDEGHRSDCELKAALLPEGDE